MQFRTTAFVVAVASGVALTADVSTFAAGPDYPPYTIVGQSGERLADSDQYGVATIVMGGRAAFQNLALRPRWGGLDLHFRYRCVYSTNNQLNEAPTRTDGEDCAPNGTTQFVKSIKISLDGSERLNYELRYECSIAYYNQNMETPYSAREGEYCGNGISGGAPLEWTTKLVVHLNRN